MPRTCSLAIAFLASAMPIAAPASADETFAGIDLLWVRPAMPAGAPRPCDRLVVLDLPRDWIAGDAAVLIVPGASDAAPAARRLVQALLEQEAAVAIFPPGAVPTCPAGPAEPVAEVLGAVRALRSEAGAGLVIAIGLGPGGGAVLAAAREEVALRYLGPDAPRLTAAIALGEEDQAAMASGEPPPATEHWPQRADLLCHALAFEVREVKAAPCLAALVPMPPLAGLAGPPSR